MNKINITKTYASCACCFIATAIGAFYQFDIMADIYPSAQALNQLFPLHLSEPASLVLSGMGLLGISSVAREQLNR